jgi:hypothetical protein
MKNSAYIILCCFLFCASLNSKAQNIITVKAGTRVIDYFPAAERYRYPEFISGMVIFKDNTSIAARLNYNILTGEVQFIQKNDTLAITNTKAIDNVRILADTFYYDNGYLEVVAGRDPSIMAIKQYIKLVDVKKEGALGTRNSTTNSQTVDYIFNGTMFNLICQEDLVLSKKTDYYLGNKSSGFFYYTKKNVLKLFPQKKSAIENFIKHNDVNFRNKVDLLQLTEFLQGMM